jgi:hypothetical protein
MNHDRTPPTPPDPQPDFELLMAYVDGELAPDEAARVERRLATDAAARAQVDGLRASAALARQAFEADLAPPVPPALRGAVEQAIAHARGQARRPTAATDRRDGNRGGAQRIGRWLAALGLDLRPAGAIAAGGALVLASVAAYQLGRAGGEPPVAGVQLVAAGERPAFDAALAGARSGERRVLPSGARIELIATFITGGGALCREFRLARGAGDALAVACRDGDAWRVGVAALAPAAGSYTPAASPAAAVDAYLGSIGAQPLSAADEAARLR